MSWVLYSVTVQLPKFNLNLDKTFENMVSYAKDHHRFKNRTGNLQKSIKYQKIGDYEYYLYIDDEQAHYGKYIHNGFERRCKYKTAKWAADPFIDNAMEKYKELFIKEIERGY